MSRVGGLTRRYYKETRGIKVTGGQRVKAGTLLTRNGDQWKAGENIIGRSHLNAACDGVVMFSKKRNRYGRIVTVVHVQPEAPKVKTVKKVKKAAAK